MLRVLTYHRVVARRDPLTQHPSLVSATADGFARQMRWLAAHYRVLSMQQVLAAAQGDAELPSRRAALVTFDDAYRDFLEVAWPILRSLGLPATLFVPTAFPGDPQRAFWWDRLYQAVTRTRRTALAAPEPLPLRTAQERETAWQRLERLVQSLPHDQAMQLVEAVCTELDDAPFHHPGVLTWPELRKLAADGLTLGAHTRTHPLLSQLPPAQVQDEVGGAQAELRREVGAALPIFCYPGGAHDGEVVSVLRSQGFLLGFSTEDGHNDFPPADPLRLRRTNITPRTTVPVLGLRLSRAGAYLDRWRHRNRPRTNGHRPAVSTPKVAYIMSRFPKITETFILFEILEQRRQGLQVDIYPLLRERQPVSHPEVEALLPQAHFQPFLSWPILRANWHYLRRKPRAYLGMIAEVLGGTFGSANFFIGALGILPKCVRFAWEMERDGITHVHAHFVTHPTVAALIIHRLTGIPFSFTAHGSDLQVDQRMLDRKVAAAAFAVTVSEYNRELMVSKCGEEARGKIHIIRCGVDTERLAPRPRAERSRRLQLLSIGSLEEVKGHEYLIEACRLLAQQSVDFDCHIVGDGPLRKQLERQVMDAGLAGKVGLLGPQPRPEVLRRLREADLMVLASMPTRNGKREGIPVALMEGMACGLPVVSSAISGIPELVEDGVSGFLCPPRDPVALAAALQRLARDPELRRHMGAAGRERVLCDFQLQRNTARLAALVCGNGQSSAVAADIHCQEPELVTAQPS